MSLALAQPARNSRLADGSRRSLILHADDFGMNAGITNGILRGFSEGLLTSTAVLANAPDAARALQCWIQVQQENERGTLLSSEVRASLERPGAAPSNRDRAGTPFDLGVHFNLTQGRPLTGSKYPARLLDDEGRFPGIRPLFFRLLRSRPGEAGAIARELTEQMDFVRDHGLTPTHANGHQYVELIPPVGDLVCDLLPRCGINVVRMPRERPWWRTMIGGRLPVAGCVLAEVKRHFASRFFRRVSRSRLTSPESFFGAAHAGRIGIDELRFSLNAERFATTLEIAVHPSAFDSDDVLAALDGWHDPLAALRPREMDVLTGSELRNVIWREGWRLGRLAGLTREN